MNKKKTYIGLAIFVAILVLGIGYAAISDVTINLDGTANVKANADFVVEYDTEHTVVKSTSDSIDMSSTTTPDLHSVVAGAYTDESNATMTVYLDSEHRSAYAIYKVDNNSEELNATLASNITNISGSDGTAPNTRDFSDYITVTSAVFYTDEECTTPLGTDELAAGTSAYLKVLVTLTKLPTDDIAGASFAVTTTATPVETATN